MPPEILQKRDPVAVRRILESLPDWFGDPGAIDNYETAAADSEFVSIVAVDSGKVIGVSLTGGTFASLPNFISLLSIPLPGVEA